MDQTKIMSDRTTQPNEQAAHAGTATAKTISTSTRKNPDEPYYSAEQIEIPRELPEILKNFTKAAIKTQPADLLKWSHAYFRAQVAHEPAPVKERLELASAAGGAAAAGNDNIMPLTVGTLKTLHRQLGYKERWTLNEIQQRWSALGLSIQRFSEVVKVGNFRSAATEWLKFLVLACGEIEQSLSATLATFCEVVTREPDGNHPRIPFKMFSDIYLYLVRNFEGVPPVHADKVLEYLQKVADKNGGLVHPVNWISDSNCPPLAPSPAEQQLA